MVVEAIHRGAQLLEPALTPFGFMFRLRESAPARPPGSPYIVGVAGPAYAIGEFRHEDRVIRFELSWSLGPVTYHIGDAFVDHEAYMRALGVAVGVNRYPGGQRALSSGRLRTRRRFAGILALSRPFGAF